MSWICRKSLHVVLKRSDTERATSETATIESWREAIRDITTKHKN